MKTNVNEINAIVIKALNYIHQVREYDKWSPEFCKEEVIDILDKLDKQLIEYDFVDLNKEELKKLGFTVWYVKDTNEYIMLIPMYLGRVIMYKGIEVVDIFGKRTKSSMMDNDHRQGMLAYGILLKD